MGYPYTGETFQLYSNNPNTFFAEKQKKYGPIFKTHILGCPCIMVSSPEAAKFVLVTKAHLFKPTFPASKERMLGRQAIFFQQGEYHARLRKLVLRAFTPGATRGSVPGIEDVALRALNSWDGQLINTFQEMKTVSSPVFIFILIVDPIIILLFFRNWWENWLRFGTEKLGYFPASFQVQMNVRLSPLCFSDDCSTHLMWRSSLFSARTRSRPLRS